MALTAAQLQQIINQAAAESGGKFVPFDPVFYNEQYGDSINAWLSIPGNAGKSLLQHYVDVGSTQGFRTSAAFDPLYYFTKWPDLQAAGLSGSDLFAHWVVHGIAEGRSAVAALNNFDGGRYLAENPDVAAYVNAHLADFLGSVTNGAIGHFVKFGAQEGRLGFDTAGNSVGLTVWPASAAITFSNGILDLDSHFGETVLTKAAAPIDGAATHGVLRLTGDADLRIDFTNSANQIRGIDLSGDTVISNNGIENNVGNVGVLKASHFTIVDAYARNPINIFDTANNFAGDIDFDGTGYFGDGVSTNGNIFLGGLGGDRAYGGIGNDFLAGGGSFGFGGWAATGDTLNGGRNADFFFVEHSALDPTDNPTLQGGETEDVDPPAGQSASLEDFDWVLFEASDDNEPDGYTLGGGNQIENFNASGNLYGFLNHVAVNLGHRAVEVLDGRLPTAAGDGSENYGVGTTAQLDISDVGGDDNIIIAGYDNDNVWANSGRDVLFGGDLEYLITNLNNPNLTQNGGLHLNVRGGLVTDGVDNLQGGGDDDAIVLEFDGGTIDGGGDNGTASEEAADTGDTLFTTNFSTGRVDGAKLADEAGAQAAALAVATKDSTVRIDLGNDAANASPAAFRGYGGSGVGGQDQTNYATGLTAVQINNMESVITTGLGRVDYDADGGNQSELFKAQQNFAGLNANVDLRGDDADNTLYANTGTDVVEGRTGDDLLSGGKGADKLVFDFGDGVDVVHRQKDANGDGLWDGYDWVKDSGGQFTQDFRAPQQGDLDASQLKVDFLGTDLAAPGVDVTQFVVKVGATTLVGGTVAQLSAATSLADLATIVNTAFHAADANVSVSVVGTALAVTDKLGRVFGTDVATGTIVAGTATGGTLQTVIAYTPSGGIVNDVEDDILFFRDYANRSINLGTDATKNEINNAASLVANFAPNADGTPDTRLANGQRWDVELKDVREGDIVSVIVNGKEVKYTVKAGEDSFDASTGLAAAINATLDKHSAAGTLAATATNTDNVGTKDWQFGDTAVVEVTQNLANGATYMTLAPKVIDGVTGADVTAQRTVVTNESATHIDLFGFKGTNGGLNGHDVVFVGKTDTSVSLLQTAKDAGEAITGKDATEDADNAGVWINGDDLLIGGLGNDTLKGGTGDDVIIASAGTDAVDGGGKAADGKFDFVDRLQAEQGTFDPTYADAGFKFATTLDADYTKTGAGTLTATNGKGVAVGTTAFTGIEVVRMLADNQLDVLDVKAVSDKIAVDSAADLLATEGVTVNLLTANSKITATVDVNNNNALAASETFTLTAVLGGESVISGNANDTVNVDESQAGSNNTFNLGSQANHSDKVAAIFSEGKDTVNYDHSALIDNVPVPPDRSKVPDVTIAITGASAGTVTLTGGALGSAKSVDTLIGVEVVNVNLAATGSGAKDVLDVSALSGATINFDSLAATVGKSLGGQGTPADTIAVIDANTLFAGGVSTGAALGTELIEIAGIAQIEQFVGSSKNDRFIGRDFTGQENANQINAAGDPTKAQDVLFTNSFGLGTVTKGTGVNNVGLITVDLGDGDDVYDHRQTTDDLAVNVAYKAGDADYLIIDDTTGGGITVATLTDEIEDRIEVAKNVERYFGSTFGLNAIDLARANAATTVTFGAEQKANGNEYKDPNGVDTATKTTPADQVTGIAVSTVADGVIARFMNASASAAGGTAESLWNLVEGSKQDDTILLSGTQDREHAETFNLRGGNNKVDYTAGVVSGQADAYTLAIGDYVTVKNGNTTGLHAYTVAHSDSGGADATDTVTITRETEGGLGTLAAIGSANAADVVTIAAFLAPQATGNITGLKSVAGTTKVTEAAAFRDLVGAVGGGNNLIDLGKGAGVVNGTVVQDVALNINGQANINDNTATSIAAWENAVGSGFNDRIFGNDNANVITAGAGNDILQGRGGGDSLSGEGGNDRFVYTGTGDTADVLGGTNVTTASEIDTIADFDAQAVATDTIAFDITAGTWGLNTTGVQSAVVAAAVVNNTAGSIVLLTDNDLVTNANRFDMTAVAAALGPVTVTGADIKSGEKVVFAVDTTAQTDLYVWTASADGDVTIGASELQLLTELTGVADVGAPGAGVFSTSSLAVRVGAQAGPQTLNLEANVRNEVVYNNANQSLPGAVDSIGSLGAAATFFVSGQDKIDLSGLNLGATNGLLINGIITRDHTGLPATITDVNATNFFYQTAGDNTSQQRAVVIEFDGDVDIDPGAGTAFRSRIYIDVDGNGQLDTTKDMFIDVISDQATLAGNAEVPLFGDFIFVGG